MRSVTASVSWCDRSQAHAWRRDRRLSTGAAMERTGVLSYTCDQGLSVDAYATRRSDLFLCSAAGEDVGDEVCVSALLYWFRSLAHCGFYLAFSSFISRKQTAAPCYIFFLLLFSDFAFLPLSGHWRGDLDLGGDTQMGAGIGEGAQLRQ